MPGINTVMIGVAAVTAVDNVLSRPIAEAENRILTRYVLTVITPQPANLQTAHNNFLDALRNDAAIPQNVKSLAELRLNRTLFLFNQLRNNRIAFDNAFRASGNNAAFLDTLQAQQLNQQYGQAAGVLRRIVPEDAFRELLTYASARPIRKVPPD